MVEQAPSQVPPTSTASAEEITQRSDESAFKLYKPTSQQLAQTPGVLCPSCSHYTLLIGELSS